MYIAEHHFGKLSNDIKLGSILLDYITLSPNFSIEESHKQLKNFKHKDFELAWNLHVLIDEISEKEFFYPNTPVEFRNRFGDYVGHIFLETAFDIILWKNGIYYNPPDMDKSIISDIENYFHKNLSIIRSSMKFLLNWEKENYPHHLTLSLIYICGYHHNTLTKSQVQKLLKESEKIIKDQDELLNIIFNRIENMSI
jgi:hypothetical protein